MFQTVVDWTPLGVSALIAIYAVRQSFLYREDAKEERAYSREQHKVLVKLAVDFTNAVKLLNK